jgi:hypothetical protein
MGPEPATNRISHQCATTPSLADQAQVLDVPTLDARAREWEKT